MENPNNIWHYTYDFISNQAKVAKKEV